MEALGGRLKHGKTRSPSRVLSCFELRFEICCHAQEFIDASADAIGIAPDNVELNDQKCFSQEIGRDMA